MESSGAAATANRNDRADDVFGGRPRHLHWVVIAYQHRAPPAPAVDPPGNSTLLSLIADSAGDALTRAVLLRPVEADGWYYLRDVVEHFDDACH